MAGNDVFKERLGVEILAHPLEAEHLQDVDRTIEPGETLEVGGLRIDPLHTPGHTGGMLSFLVDGHVFTGDTLFKDSVGGVKAPGSTGFADLKHSIMDVLLVLPPETVVQPGHTDPTTRGRRVGQQPVRARLARPRPRVARSAAPSGSRPPRWSCGRRTTTAGTRPGCAGTSPGEDDIVPGSQVERA